MSYVPKTVDPKTAAAARRFMRLAPAAQAEALAAYQRLPGESTMAALEAEVAALKRRVRQYAKALRISCTLTGWAMSSEVEAKIRAALKPRKGKR